MWSQLGPIARRRAELGALVTDAQEAWSDLGAPDGFVAGELAALRQRLQHQHATVGVFGLIKRGKSTLVNALVGAEASRMRAVPETAVPVRVTHSDSSFARVHLVDGRVLDVEPDEVHTYTSQAENQGNRRGVVMVERGVDSPILEGGVDVVDLPGLDDAEADETYTRRTLQQLDTVDAGVVVFQSPPTVSGTELDFLQEVVSSHPRKVVVVCNFYPQHFDDPDTREAVMEYTLRQLDSRGLGRIELVPVCALRLWEAARDRDPVQWGEGGGHELDRALEQTLLRSLRGGLVRQSGQDLARTLQVALGQVELLERAQGPNSDAIVAALHKRLETPAQKAEGRRRRLEGVRIQARTIIQQVVQASEQGITEADSVEDVRVELDRFRRALEVQAEEATRVVLRQLVDDPRRRETLLSELADWRDGGVHVEGRDTPATAATAKGAAVGGVLGGAGLTLLATALGPVGLVAGALAGSLLGRSAAKQQTVRAAKEQALAAMEEIADQVVADLEDRTEAALSMVEQRETRRHETFDRDLQAVLEHVTHGSDAWREPAARLRELCEDADVVRSGAPRLAATG